MSKESSMRRTNVWLTNKQATKLEALAERTGLRRAEHIRRAIDGYLDMVAREEKGASDGKGE